MLNGRVIAKKKWQPRRNESSSVPWLSSSRDQNRMVDFDDDDDDNDVINDEEGDTDANDIM